MENKTVPEYETAFYEVLDLLQKLRGWDFDRAAFAIWHALENKRMKFNGEYIYNGYTFVADLVAKKRPNLNIKDFVTRKFDSKDSQTASGLLIGNGFSIEHWSPIQIKLNDDED